MAAPPFQLVLDPATGTSAAGTSLAPRTRLLGLSLPLRLALTAHAAGAIAVVAADPTVREALRDARLRIPVRDAPDASLPVVRAAANLVVHRATIAAIAAAGAQETALEPESACDAPFGFTPLLVADRASARRASRALLRSLRKPLDGWTATYLNRGISLTLTRLLVRTPLTPNQLSVLILGIGLFGAYLASRGTYATMLAGAILFQAQSVLDGCDGEISRITFRGSKLGEWLDTIGDDLTNYAFFGAAAWGLFTATGRPFYLVLGAITVACGIAASGIEYRYLYRIGSGDLLKYPIGIGKTAPAERRRVPLARAGDAIAPLFKRDTFVLLTLLGALFGVLSVFLAVFAAGGVGILAAVLRAEVRMAKDATR
jgi:phosphatidylglycerophosphate synthase